MRPLQAKNLSEKNERPFLKARLNVAPLTTTTCQSERKDFEHLNGAVKPW